MRIKADITGIASAVVRIRDGARIDGGLKLYANGRLARYCEPYVPASSAKLLAMPSAITEEYVQYRGPYAHYQYMGEVYGPNIPITENGMIVGYFSPPGKPKTKTDRKLQYSHDVHPLAQSHWDQAAMVRHLGDLEDDIGGFIERRINDGE
jgi:hypothetical protein